MREITVLGYGNQGKAWAKNLRDSGWTVTVSGRSSSLGGRGIAEARSDGFPILQLDEIQQLSSPIAVLLPDEVIPRFFIDYFPSENRKGRAFVFAHGFSVVYGELRFQPLDDVVLVAPKGIGPKLRELYQSGSGVMGVLGVQQDGSGTAWDLARSVGVGLGCHRIGMLERTFAEETNADLLSEQAILCGLLPMLIEQCAKFMVSKGIHPQVAVYECLQETKLIVDMMVAKGIDGMYRNVSTTAKFGGLRAQDKILNSQQLREKLENLWSDITSGAFAEELRLDQKQDFMALKQRQSVYKNSLVDSQL